MLTMTDKTSAGGKIFQSKGQIWCLGCYLPTSLNCYSCDITVYVSVLQPTIPSGEERSTIITTITTQILMVLMDKASPTHLMILTSAHVVSRWCWLMVMDWWDKCTGTLWEASWRLLYFSSIFHLAGASVFRSGCRVPPSCLMTRGSLWHACLCWWTFVCDHVCRGCLQGP